MLPQILLPRNLLVATRSAKNKNKRQPQFKVFYKHGSSEGNSVRVDLYVNGSARGNKSQIACRFQ